MRRITIDSRGFSFEGFCIIMPTKRKSRRQSSLIQKERTRERERVREMEVQSIMDGSKRKEGNTINDDSSCTLPLNTLQKKKEE